jgi:preprotein translocase subunit SecA
MLANMLKKVLGSKNARDLRRINTIVKKVNDLEQSLSALDDAQLAGKTVDLRHRLDTGESVEMLLP